MEKLIFPYSRMAYLPMEGDDVDLRHYNPNRSAPHMSIVTLATPEQWRRMQEQFPQEKQAGVFSHYKVDARFLTAFSKRETLLFAGHFDAQPPI